MLAPWTWPLYWIGLCLLSSATWTRFKTLTDPRCIKCGGEVEEGLSSLGSIHCHDCRRPGNVKHGGFSG